MRASRITLAVQNGALPTPAEGDIAVFRARADHDLSAFPGERLHVIQGFCPDHDALTQRGLRCDTAPLGPYGAALVACTRSKAETLGLIATALTLTAPGGWVAVDGQKTDGVEALLKACGRALTVTGTLSKAHGRLFVLTRPEVLPACVADWSEAAAPRAGPDGKVTQAGLFSADSADAGSQLLAGALAGALVGDVADLGAGSGSLAAAVLAHTAVKRLDLIEAEHAALEAARLNVSDPRAEFLWQDATLWRPGAIYDRVISNPPFHRGRAADVSLGQAFIRTASAVLKPGGKFMMVANRQLPYEETLNEVFADVRALEQTPAFKIIAAMRPRTAAPRGRRRKAVPSGRGA